MFGTSAMTAEGHNVGGKKIKNYVALLPHMFTLINRGVPYKIPLN